MAQEARWKEVALVAGEAGREAAVKEEAADLCRPQLSLMLLRFLWEEAGGDAGVGDQRPHRQMK